MTTAGRKRLEEEREFVQGARHSERVAKVTRGEEKRERQQRMRNCATLEMICQYHSKDKTEHLILVGARRAKRTRLPVV